jgi:hypothetical protein
MPVINQVVATPEKLIQIGGQLPAGCIFAHGGKIGSGLAIQ